MFLNSIELILYIGVYDWERKNLQKVDIDIEMHLSALLLNNNPVVDYANLAEELQSRYKHSAFGLIEELVEDIATWLLQKDCLEKVCVRIHKSVIVAGNPKSATIEVERWRQ